MLGNSGVDGSRSSLQLLRSKDAAGLLAISPRKLWELANRGEIRCVRIGRSVRFDMDDLRDWVEKRKRRGNQ